MISSKWKCAVKYANTQFGMNESLVNVNANRTTKTKIKIQEIERAFNTI